MSSLKVISIFLVLVVTLASGIYPFFKKLKAPHKSHSFPIGESLAAGVFLGAALLHMLGDASHDFYTLNVDYPIAFLISGATFLLFLLMEHIGRELYHREGGSGFAILAVVMLSIHSFFAGAALGLSGSFSVVLLLLFAILAHKWAASFALAVEINKSTLPVKYGLLLFVIFALMVPLGILFGSSVSCLSDCPVYLKPVFTAIASGTFLYLGTLHGLEKAALIKQCCSLKNYYYVIVGFTIMAVVAIWT